MLIKSIQSLDKYEKEKKCFAKNFLFLLGYFHSFLLLYIFLYFLILFYLFYFQSTYERLPCIFAFF